MKFVLPFLLMLLLFSCKRPGDDPGLIPFFEMSAWVNYATSPISLELRGQGFRLSGPFEAPFDSAWVYVSEDKSYQGQLLATTTQTSLPLRSLKAGTIYYITVQGKGSGRTSQYTKPILAIADVMKPTNKLMPYDQSYSYYLSPTGFPIIRGRRDAAGNYVNQLIDAAGGTETLSYTNTENGTFFCTNWAANSQRALFEISRSKKRAFVSYDLTSSVYTDVKLPADVEIWNYAVAPDGNQLVFADYKRPGLWYFDGITNTQKKLDDQQTIYGLTWTADSQRILLTQPIPGDRQAVRQYDPQAGTPPETLSEGLGFERFSLSPNRKYALFSDLSSGHPTLWLKNLTTGTLKPVGSWSQFGWLNNGTGWVAYRSDNTKPATTDGFIWQFTP